MTESASDSEADSEEYAVKAVQICVNLRTGAVVMGNGE